MIRPGHLVFLFALTGALTTMLAGCAPQLEGEYVDAQGAVAFRLAHGKYVRTNADGSLYLHARSGHAPLPIASPYKIDGQALLVAGATRARPNRVQFTILPNGRLKLSQDGRELIFVRK